MAKMQSQTDAATLPSGRRETGSSMAGGEKMPPVLGKKHGPFPRKWLASSGSVQTLMRISLNSKTRLSDLSGKNE
ncbi:hypothetical protein [Aporhodopirellula rubra]|uniref:hypothetical protein n=1 Tax=Aporhodopirellula rubra TaxID=980271 RepID=UPI001619CDD8|nr:hypothetical protein [Aporhodopirellula rubra]